MSEIQYNLCRPIRVVMFGSGPELNPDAKQFLYLLEEHPDIVFLGAFCQSQSQSVRAVFYDLWKRRGILALPLFSMWLLNKISRYLFHPRTEFTLQNKMNELSDRIHFVVDIHSQQVLEKVRKLEPDLGLVFGSPILKPALFEIPRLGTLGIHHGKVPEYRGNKTAFWAMYNGEPTAGVTIQKINKGLDTGSIVKTGQVKADHRSYRSVFKDLEQLGLELYIQAILEVKQGVAEYKPQTGAKGKLYRNPKLGDFIRFFGMQIKRRSHIGE